MGCLLFTAGKAALYAAASATAKAARSPDKHPARQYNGHTLPTATCQAIGRQPGNFMIRVTELALPLDHPEHALRAAILQRLQLRDEELLNFPCSNAATTPAKRTARSSSSTSSISPCRMKPRYWTGLPGMPTFARHRI